MKKLLLLCVVACLTVSTFAKDEDEDKSKAEDRVKAASTVLEEIESAPDQGIPEEVLGSAECVAVVPTMIKGGFIVGARFGRGVASCRTPKGWSAPAFFTIKGGSIGLQIGAQAVDLVMLIMNDDGMKNLLNSQFKLGADVSVAAGPVGRHAAADTDWKLKAQVLSYSRARGLFAGLELSGAAVGQDKDATREFYGRMVPFKTSLKGTIPGKCVSVSEHAGQMGENGSSQQVTRSLMWAQASSLVRRRPWCCQARARVLALTFTSHFPMATFTSFS
jgi:lipid-binding SYLF domain-containing protein